MKTVIGVLLVALLAFGVPTAGSAQCVGPACLDVKGETVNLNNGGVAILYTDAMNSIWTSSGSGVIDPFLTVQKNGVEEGMNTDASPPPYDAKRGANPGYSDGYTRSLRLSEVFYAPFSGYETYFNFSLDTDQSGNETPSNPFVPNAWISLNQFEVWLVPEAAGGSLSTYAQLAASGGVKEWSLASPTPINLDYSIWSGSGNKLDMALLVPGFSGNPGDYVYVWCQFDQPYDPNDGPEEWINFGSVRVPEPTALLLLGAGLLGLVGVRRRFKK